MPSPTVATTYSSHSNDGGNAGLGVTTDTAPTTGDVLFLAAGINANGDTMTKPSVAWTEVTVSDNLVATQGGQYRVWYLPNPSDATTYAYTTSSATRRTCIGVLVRGADLAALINTAASLESAAGTNHAPPSVTTTVDGAGVLDIAGLRQFSPDTASWDPPASGLSWTELADLQGSDGNNNVRLAAAFATAGAAGALSTVAWTTTDPNEEAIVLRIAIKGLDSGVSADATLSVTATMSGAATAAKSAGASLAIAATTTAAATPTRAGGASLAVTATLGAAATPTRAASASLAVTASLSASANVGVGQVTADASLAVSVALSGSAAASRPAGAALTATATITAGAAGIPRTAAAALAVVATIVAALDAEDPRIVTIHASDGLVGRMSGGDQKAGAIHGV